MDTIEALYAPVLSNGIVVGVIHVDTTQELSAFTDDDLRLLSVIANTIGPALKSSSGLARIPSIFISYSHDDRVFAGHLTADLRRRGVKVYIDERLQAGESWRKQLAVAIENTDAFVLLLSPSSVESEYVEWELDTAQGLNKKVFPLMCEQASVPPAITALQYINIGKDYEKGLDQLAERLHGFRNDVFEAAGNLPKTSPERSIEKSPVSGEAKYILHLSDLHFGTRENALNWHSQLAEDLLKRRAVPAAGRSYPFGRHLEQSHRRGIRCRHRFS